jgi:hypothetical protein
VDELMRKIFYSLFVCALSFSHFLDAVNIDDLVCPKGMAHEEYEGESKDTHGFDLLSEGVSHNFRTGAGTISQPSTLTAHVHQCVDEDSPSLAAYTTLVQESVGPIEKHGAAQLLNGFHPPFDPDMICELQI